MIELRPLRPADIGCAESIVAAHDPALAPLLSRDLKAHFGHGDAARSLFLAAVEADRVVGVMGLQPDTDPDVHDIVWAVWLYVDPAAASRGIGKALMEAIIEAARARGARKLYLDVGNRERHERAIAMYDRRGFVQEGELRDYFAPGEHKLLYGLRLDR